VEAGKGEGRKISKKFNRSAKAEWVLTSAKKKTRGGGETKPGVERKTKEDINRKKIKMESRAEKAPNHLQRGSKFGPPCRREKGRG